MKTQKEIEKMKDDIEGKIQDTQKQIYSLMNIHSEHSLYDKKRQLMAQYNILLEVLK